VRQNPQNTIVPALATLATIRVPNRIDDAVDRPHSSQNSRRGGVLEAGNRHCAQSSRVVLVEVLVRALGGVEGQHGFGRRGRCGLDLLVGGVLEGVRHFGGFAECADAPALPGADYEGRDGGEEDVAGNMLMRGRGGELGSSMRTHSRQGSK
jgi:hypothetical protein